MELKISGCNRCLFVRFCTIRPRFTLLFIKVLLVLVWSAAGYAISQEHELLLQESEKGTNNIKSHSCIHDQIIEQRKRPGFKVYSISPQVYKEQHISKPLQRKGRALLEVSEFSGKQDNAKQPIRINLNYEAVGHSPDRDCRNIGEHCKGVYYQ
ncbi:uncharacterized protein LOC141711455 [Apium graveolens]|uniref:uncharacterized protein LOC141711455 n=1 Tax=Apium graveolens TaxID=4045 RepID=UPI003D78D807